MDEDISLEVDLGIVKKRSFVGVLALTSRTFLVQVISFASTFFLTVFLDPRVFGIYGIVSASIAIFRNFSDIGLAAALIQKKEQITKEDLETTFVVQQTLAIILFAVIFGVSPLLKRIYGFDHSAIFLLYALAFSFFLSSLKTIPSVLLERTLRFNLLIIPQLLETVVYSVLVVIFAWRGMGINSFSYSVLAQGIVGLIAMYIISPWKPGFTFSRQSLKKLLKFGVPYQANTFVAMAKDDLMTVFLGKIIGTTGLGYLLWAKKWAEQPLRFFMDNVLKVTFPAFSRMQEDKKELKKAVEKSVFFLAFLTFPILLGFSLIASDLVKIIPRWTKWQPALLALYFYCFNSAWATISTTMTNLLNALGKIKTTFKLMLMWLVLTWVLMPILGVKLGYNGIALSAALISVSSVVAVYCAKKNVDFDLPRSIGKPLIASFFLGIILFFFKPFIFNLWFSIGLRVLVGGAVYLFISYVLVGKELVNDLSKIYHEFRKNK